jgi:hypothetical protein
VTGLDWMPNILPTHPILDEIESRAGASDADEAAWLQERRHGVTATQVRDLWLWEQYRKHGGEKPRYAKTEQELILDKLGIEPLPFVATKFTVWGHTREAALADRAAWAHAVEPESRVFHAADNPRFLGSPDGLGVFKGALRLGEYKTTTKPIPVGSHALAQKGYVAQMMWCLRVLGRTPEDRAKARCMYIWEQHNNQWVDVGGVFPEPSGILDSGEHWIDWDQGLADELEVIAVRFLEHLDSAAGLVAQGRDPFADDLDPDDFEVLIASYLGALAARDRADQEMREYLEQIAERAGDGWEKPIVTRAGRATPVVPSSRRSFDEAAWARRAPAQYAQYQAAKAKYVKLTPVKASIRVTPPVPPKGEQFESNDMEEAA